MLLYHCLLTLHDNVFFATREMGILYETEKYLHNWALSFALFNVDYIPHSYRLHGEKAQKPTYLDDKSEQNLLHLNQAKIYVFPAQPIIWSYQVNTFKAAQVAYYGKSKQFGDKGADKNYPINYGRAKELAVGSKYRTYIIAPDRITIPQWIRLGKWSAKVKVESIKIPDSVIKKSSGDYTCSHPLNPLDLSHDTDLILYNRIVMPPVSLISQARLSGEYFQSIDNQEWQNLKRANPELPNQFRLPRGTLYGAKNLIAA
ncbi:type I-D CRISPR-associated protein Cas5/Csc1 [Mastigocoleus sp. MO_188.B34]|uniref:type I-D CRISPR-associated protein Cas5/Csc1 n=1 Tax=Mastigocoleus sp. MO_188.B34 TaxID=3036635 RepID=UPI0026326B5C|nr:type I-D CRISPR-associated protein Cas5/Csc1 [Mastigocoleus sp. MO_188.B34]MDJ0693257.1 type I-D CRISPR-associated protein Cas5/Csc1 [Mastigocoleus sp. MO_188.B34]